MNPEAHTAGTDREYELIEALMGIRGVVLGPLGKRKSLCLINEIVGEAVYGDFPGALEKANHG